MSHAEYEGQSQGPATDRVNNPVVDPSANVLDLVAAAVLRLDDLRIAEAKLRDSESIHLKEMSQERAEHAKELRAAESQRIDAIRAVDVAASQQQTRDAEQRASALATQVSASAEAMRTQVAAAAQSSSQTLTQALDPIQKDIADLRRAQYEQQGQKQQVVEGRAGGANFGMWVGVVIGALAIVISIIILATRPHTTNNNNGTGGSSTSLVCTATYHPAPCP